MDITSYIRHFVHDIDSTRYTDALIQHYIKLAMIDFATKTQFFTKEIHVEANSNSKITAVLPPDVIEVREVYLDGQPLPIVLESDLNDLQEICGVNPWKCKRCKPELVIANTNPRELILWPAFCKKDEAQEDTFGIVDGTSTNRYHCNDGALTLSNLFGIIPIDEGVTSDIILDRISVKYTYTPIWEDLFNPENTSSTLASQMEIKEVVKSFVCWKLLLQDDDNKSIAMSDREHQTYNSYVKEYKHRKANLMKTRGVITVGNMNEFSRR